MKKIFLLATMMVFGLSIYLFANPVPECGPRAVYYYCTPGYVCNNHQICVKNPLSIINWEQCPDGRWVIRCRYHGMPEQCFASMQELC